MAPRRDCTREEERTSPPTIAVALERAVMRINLGKCLVKVQAVCLCILFLDVMGVYLGFIDVDWVCLCIFSD